jgi:hypothetical protein
MVEFDLELDRKVPLTLELINADIRGDAPSAPALLDRFSLGLPILIHLSADNLKGDPAAVAYLEQNAGHEFYLIRLACTFNPNEAEPFREAWLRVSLTGSAIAWAMHPSRSFDYEDISKKLNVEVGFKFGVLEGKAAYEGGGDSKRERIFLEAKGLQETAPHWHFRSTPARKLDGSFPLALIARTRKDERTSGRIELKVTVERPRLGVLTYGTPTSFSPSVLLFDLA